jgi:hypothetical protein
MRTTTRPFLAALVSLAAVAAPPILGDAKADGDKTCNVEPFKPIWNDKEQG